jgi:acetylornithine deacetylase
VDPVAVVDLARALVDVDSTTGSEAAVCDLLAAWLRRAGYHVVEQPVGGDRRRNLFATLDPPQVVLSTHVDCVPPFVPSRIEGDCLYGRGACDAKGAVAAQIAAVERLRRLGERRVGLLFVVGEERGSDGARAAAALAPGTTRAIVDGEPTGNRLARATRGAFRVRLRARGRAAHSSYPECGESAIEKLVDALVALRAAPWPSDPMLGRTHYTVGLVQGGIAPNVVPPAAEAEVVFRTTAPAADLREIVRRLAASSGVEVEEVLEVPPVQFAPLAGFDTAVFPFTTDVPFLAPWGRPVLVGPGSALVAHTDEEHVAIAELLEAVEVYTRVAEHLLRDVDAGAARGPA